jgi:hypothetical protein
MSKNAPPSEATIPDVGNSPSSLISAAAVADVELTISPDAADAAATVSKVSYEFIQLYEFILERLHMN